MAIPGLGPLIAAGPIIAALSGGAIGAGVGGLTGALVGLGIPEYEAKRYEGKVKEGGIFISVHSENNEEVTSAKNIFKEEGAHDISSTGEAHADPETQDISKKTTKRSTPRFVTIEQIQLRAYFLAERRKSLGVSGDEIGDWAQAEQELRLEATEK